MQIFIQTLIAAVGVTAFAVLFQAPRRLCPACGITGALGWALYLVLTQLAGWGAPAASVAAALLITLLARVFAVVYKCPTTVFLVCGVFPIVPGAGIYYTAYYFITAQNELCVQTGVETVKIAVGIAVGIVLVLALPTAGAVRRRQTPPKP